MIKEKELSKKAARYADGVVRALVAVGPRPAKWAEIDELIKAAYFNGFQSGVVWQKSKVPDLDEGDRSALVRALMRALEHTPAREQRAHKKVYDRISEFIVQNLPKKTLGRVAAAMDRASGR